MLVQLATEPARSGINEDFVAATPNAVVLLDGAGSAGAETGCVHGVDWYARELGVSLLDHLTSTSADLRRVLRTAIGDVIDQHKDTCDLSHAATPSATVVLLRVDGPSVDYLVLSDSVLILDTTKGVRVVTDERGAVVGKQFRPLLDRHPNGTEAHAAALRTYLEAMRQHRNRRGGFWVAATDPGAAREAITGSVPLADINAAALLSDGASRLADTFRLADWSDILDLLARQGPDRLISRVREAERSDRMATRWPRAKTHDDATVAYCGKFGGG